MTTTLTNPLWLSAFCGTDMSRHELTTPMAIEVGGRRAIVATNGHRMLALWDRFESYPAPSPVLATSIVRYLTPAPDAAPIDLHYFRAFLSTIVPVTRACALCLSSGAAPCGRCDGDGMSLRGEYLCGFCMGTGEVSCNACGDDGTKLIVVRVGAGTFNARYLARPMDAIAGSRATWSQPDSEKAAVLAGEGWTLAVMPRLKYGDTPAGTYSLGDFR